MACSIAEGIAITTIAEWPVRCDLSCRRASTAQPDNAVARNWRSVWVHEAPAAAVSGPRAAFGLFIVFLLMLYSNIAVIYSATLDAFRPTLVVAVAALFMMIIELGQARQSFRLMWPQGVLLLTLLAACVLSTFDAIYVRHAAEQTTDFAKMVLVYLLIENVVTTERRLRIVMFTMVAGGLFPAIGTIVYYRAGILQEQSRAAWRGIFGNPNEAAYGILILVPIALALSCKSRSLVRLALCGMVVVYLIAMFFTFSRGGFLALFTVVGLMGWKQKSVLVKAGLALLLLVGIVVLSMFWKRSSGDFSNLDEDTSFQERMATFQAGGLMFLNNPLLGVGPGDSMVAYPLYVPVPANCGCHDQLVIHNSFIQALGELGLLGFIPFVLFIGVAIYQARKMEQGPLGSDALALELAMWAVVVCGLSGGFVYTWWPYILVGLITAMKRMTDMRAPCAGLRGLDAV
jgi:O-antigen ligase